MLRPAVISSAPESGLRCLRTQQSTEAQQTRTSDAAFYFLDIGVHVLNWQPWLWTFSKVSFVKCPTALSVKEWFVLLFGEHLPFWALGWQAPDRPGSREELPAQHLQLPTAVFSAEHKQEPENTRLLGDRTRPLLISLCLSYTNSTFSD